MSSFNVIAVLVVIIAIMAFSGGNGNTQQTAKNSRTQETVYEEAVIREDIINLNGQVLDVENDEHKQDESNSKTGAIGTKLF